MTYKTIRNEVDEILNLVSSLSEDEIEESMERIAELSEFLENLNENDASEDDTEYQEIAEMIEETEYSLESELNSRDVDTEEDYY